MVLPSFARPSSRRPVAAAPARPGCSWAIGLTACLIACVAAAAAEPAAGTPHGAARRAERIEAHKEALARANAAVVGVEVTAVEDARSIATLGRERQGSGVLIGDDGLVLTIGYLILEADHVDLVAGRRPARAGAGRRLRPGIGLRPGPGAGAARPDAGAARRLGRRSPTTSRCWSRAAATSADLSLARMVSRRAFSGYWEYHIEGALFTAPARTDHSGAGLFNADGELVGVGSLIVGNAARQGPGAARQHVRAGRPAEADPAELRSAAARAAADAPGSASTASRSRARCA